MISLFRIQFVRKTDPKDRPFLTLAPVDTKFPKLRQLCRGGRAKVGGEGAEIGEGQGWCFGALMAHAVCEIDRSSSECCFPLPPAHVPSMVRVMNPRRAI
jgi:hypothetical protein